MSEHKIAKGDGFSLDKIMTPFLDELGDAVTAGDVKLTITIESNNDYSKKQRGALHIWCRDMATALNDAGYDMQKVLNRERPVDIPWSLDRFKEFCYKPTLEAMTGKKSTEDQKSVTPSEVYDVLARHFSKTYGVHVSWPCKEQQKLKSMGAQQR